MSIKKNYAKHLSVNLTQLLQLLKIIQSREYLYYPADLTQIFKIAVLK